MDNGIEKWQHSVLSNVSTEPSSSRHDGIASRLATAATKFFGLLLEHARLKISPDLLRALEREYNYLQLWCDGYGVPSGELDAVLAQSGRLRLATYRLLVSVCSVLADRMVVALLPSLDDSSQHSLRSKGAVIADLAAEVLVSAIHGVDDSDSDSDSGTEFWVGVGDDAVQDIIEDLSTDIQCLVDLGSRFKEPIRDRPGKEEAALPPQLPTWDPSKSMAARIRHRYPNGDDVFIEIQGRVNWERRQRLYALKESSTQAPTPKSESETKTLVVSDFYDSGLGTSVKTPSSYAETVLSYHGTRGGSIKIPPVPAEGLEGRPFTCDICGRRCQPPVSNRKSFWKKHVLSDLQPYVCVVTNCGFSGDPFPDRTAWSHHLELEHGFDDPLKNLECPLCQEKLVDHAKISHLARHLEEISLTILPTNAEDSDNDESDDDDSDDDKADDDKADDDELDGGSEDDLDEDGVTGELEGPDAAGESTATGSSSRSPGGPPDGFVCEVCGAVKSSFYQLLHHRRYHDRPWPCKEPGCERSFGTITHLKRHIYDKHSKTVKFYCTQPGCDYSRQGTKSFPRKDNWKRHMVNKHSIDPQNVTDKDDLGQK